MKNVEFKLYTPEEFDYTVVMQSFDEGQTWREIYRTTARNEETIMLNVSGLVQVAWKAEPRHEIVMTATQEDGRYKFKLKSKE